MTTKRLNEKPFYYNHVINDFIVVIVIRENDTIIYIILYTIILLRFIL